MSKTKYLTYYIKAIENLKLTDTIIQKESEQTLDYITGSSIRGSYIYKYINQYNIKNINEGEHRDKLLKGKICFLNAYPVYDEERGIPLPKCYFSPKDKIREFEFADSIDMSLGLDKELEQGFEKVRFSQFVAVDDEDYRRIKVSKISNLHIRKTTEKNNLFRYEAIKKGQVFKGIITSQHEDYLNEIKDIMEEDYIYIGGSKGSGYGKCLVYDMDITEENPEAVLFEDKNDFDEYVYLMAMSDIIYKTNLGEYKTIIEEDLLKKELQLNSVEYIDSCIETKNVSSFNNKWNCMSPQIVAVKAGSVFKYKITGEVEEELVTTFMDKGIGERKIDGFGRFVFINDLDDAAYYSLNKEIKEDNDITSVVRRLKEDDRNQVIDILTRVFEKRAIGNINKIVLDTYEKIKKPREMQKNQWGKLLELFTMIQYMDINKGKEKFFHYINHLKEKNSDPLKQLQKVRYSDRDFIDFLEDFMKNSETRNTYDSSLAVEPINIFNIKSNENKDFIYRTNIKILQELCRYHLRREEGR